MAPTAVPFKLTSTTDTMNTTTTNTLSAYIAKTGVVNSMSTFGKFQDTAVGSDLTIRTIVPPDISADPYRKTMISILFFRRVLSLSSSPSVTISDLTATVAASFAMPTSSMEREEKRIVESVRRSYLSLPRFRCYHIVRQPFAFFFFSDLFFYSQD